MTTSGVHFHDTPSIRRLHRDGGHVVVKGAFAAHPFDEHGHAFGSCEDWRDILDLGTVASVEAIFLSTFVLIMQNRMADLAEKRAELDLHISLLSEHEITRLLKLVQQLAGRMNIDAADDPELEELKRDVEPKAVLDHLDEQREKKDAQTK